MNIIRNLKINNEVLMINRDDMLELTRRMNSSRTHFVRVAGAYMDEEGYVDGSFNTNFLKLTGSERSHAIELAKSIPFANTNINLKMHRLPEHAMKPGSIWQLLYALRDCGLKNDAMLYTLYELFGEKLYCDKPYAIYVYEGVYDVPVKASDKTGMDESEEVYTYLIVAFCNLNKNQEAVDTFSGFLWPAFTDRSTDMTHVNVFQADENHPTRELYDILGINISE